jgi:hypothetical protein
MTSREQFEAWFKPRKERMKNDGIGTLNIVRYCGMAWVGWQASREAVEVELPEEARCRFKYPEAEAQCDGFNDALSQCLDAIESAGIKVKGE